jgi:NAD(P)H-dependent FMN reductase
VLALPGAREWRNRQTRTVQVRVPERAWGFNSPLAHPYAPPVTMHIAAILGSTREGRVGSRVGLWVQHQLAALSDTTHDFIDLADDPTLGTEAEAIVDDPVMLQTHLGPNFPSSGNYPASVQPYAARIARADAIIFITPEYNHSFSAPIKHAIDSIYAEWGRKAAMIVSYGGQTGGARAATQLRLVLDAVLLHTIYNEVNLNGTRYLINEQGEAGSDTDINAKFASGLHELLWWAEVLRWGRANVALPPAP